MPKDRLESFVAVHHQPGWAMVGPGGHANDEGEVGGLGWFCAWLFPHQRRDEESCEPGHEPSVLVDNGVDVVT